MGGIAPQKKLKKSKINVKKAVFNNRKILGLAKFGIFSFRPLSKGLVIQRKKETLKNILN